MKSRKYYIENFLIFLNVFSIMFSFIFFNQFYFLIFTLLLSILIVRPKVIKIQPVDKKIFFLIFVFIINSFFSFSPANSLKYVIMFILCYLNIRILFELNVNWKSKLLNYLWLAVFIHSLCVVIHFIKPNIIYSFLEKFYDSNNMMLINNLANLGSYAGICNQTGLAGFIVSIFIIMSFIKIDFSNKKIMYILFTFLGFAALFLTGKRGFVIFDILMIFLYFLFFQNGNISKKIIYFILLIMLAFLGVYILSNMGILKSFLNKLIVLQNSNDLSNGRDVLWSKTIDVFKTKPFLGNGINTIDLLFGDCTHNIYIQLLAELGILGYWVVVFWFIGNLIDSIKNYLSNKNVYNILSLFFQLLFLLYGLTGNPFYSSSFLWLYLLGIFLSEGRSVRKNAER